MVLLPEEQEQNVIYDNKNIPVIDLDSTTTDDVELARQISFACSTFGFFQITNHGISSQLIEQFRKGCAAYFALPAETKQKWKRHAGNSRGYFDDELTKRRRDWKQALDVGVPGSRDWGSTADDDSKPENHCLDGCNQLPSDDELPNFRSTVAEYFEECAKLSHRITVLMVIGLVAGGCGSDSINNADEAERHPLVDQLKRMHTSYLRMNFYPPCGPDDYATNDSPLGISPHKDAGFLTVLLQDDDCHSLQVLKEDGKTWMTVQAVPGSFTINTGDMAQIWSNGLYKAPLHRVLTNTDRERYSAPFFYNPAYTSHIAPTIVESSSSMSSSNKPRYHPVLWGYFRALRFAGDLTDLGVEIQIEDFELKDNSDGDSNMTEPSTPSGHVKKQAIFEKVCNFSEPFNVEKYRDLLLQED